MAAGLASRVQEEGGGEKEEEECVINLLLEQRGWREWQWGCSARLYRGFLGSCDAAKRKTLTILAVGNHIILKKNAYGRH